MLQSWTVFEVQTTPVKMFSDNVLETLTEVGDVAITSTMSDDSIVQSLKDYGILSYTTAIENISVEGEGDILHIGHTITHQPLFQLHNK